MTHRCLFLLIAALATTARGADLSVATYPSIQTALNANPGRMLFVPAGEYVIREKIRIRGERAGLFGPGRIIQERADQPIIEIVDATAAEVRDLTLTRPQGKMETNNEGFSKNDLWAIGLMPGAASHPAADGKPETANADGASVIANNIISDFGHGHAHWIWGAERSPFKFDTGQQPDDPPLADVIVQGNVVQALGKPRYRYAVIIPGGPDAPRGLHFSNNLLHPGTAGVSNTELPP